MSQSLFSLISGGSTSQEGSEPAEGDWPLRDRPGFLIRRVHQLHVAQFVRECGDFDITPIQYSLLAALADLDQADQSQLAAAIAMDRTTTAGALKRLEARGLVERRTLPTDRRAQFCSPTPEGLALLKRLEAPARAAHTSTIEALSPAEQFLFLQLLQKIVDQADADPEA
ncbi:MarR family winged helix-turn-helix transcriptional regulator [Sphingomonas sp.]|uniref:MarR family winged helix-turn-helix transcriptional regulator n=1 Tax=Sphingomonas sp. TaxID=28214 RepID=UPI000DB787C4|nr:MarR family winged helix-turn-helix transcriptional regulator [Sphingomonas sp.]PZU08009.1 MAG: MarR family transcriptional regulator [Sphingomonas sp.]